MCCMTAPRAPAACTRSCTTASGTTSAPRRGWPRPAPASPRTASSDEKRRTTETQRPRRRQMLSGDRDLTERVIGLAIDVHRHLGPGLLESAYEECLSFELSQAGIEHRRQVPLPVVYKDVRLDCGYRIDIVVRQQLIIEIKAIERIVPVHEAQILTYLRLSGYKVGLLLNFNSVVLKDGLRRFVLRQSPISVTSVSPW